MYQNRKFDYFDFLFFYFKKFIIFTKMDKFRVKLERWLKANPGVIPKYTIYVETQAFGMRPGSFTEFCDYKFEDRFDRMQTLPGVKVKTFYILFHKKSYLNRFRRKSDVKFNNKIHLKK